MAIGKGAAKALVGAIRLDGAPVGDEGWRHTAAVIANANRQREVKARWASMVADRAGCGTTSKPTRDDYEARTRAGWVTKTHQHDRSGIGLEGDEVELSFENGQRKVLIESLEKSPPPASTHPTIADPDDAAAAVA